MVGVCLRQDPALTLLFWGAPSPALCVRLGGQPPKPGEPRSISLYDLF